MGEKRLYTLEERMERFKAFKAASPRAAAGKILSMANIHAAHFFENRTDLNLMFEIIGEYDTENGGYFDVDHYKQFSRVFLALVEEGEDTYMPEEGPMWGRDTHNALVLMLVCMITSLRCKKKRGNPLQSLLRMTLGDYLDGLTDLTFQEDGRIDTMAAKHYHRIRESSWGHYNADKPVQNVLEDMFREYMKLLEDFYRLRYIIHWAIRCSYLQDTWEELSDEEQETFGSPAEFFEQKLQGFHFDIADADGTYVDIRSEYLERDITLFYFLEEYESMTDPETVIEMCHESGIDPEFMELLEEVVYAGVNLANSMSLINAVVRRFYDLFVLPFVKLEQKNYHYERHLEAEELEELE